MRKSVPPDPSGSAFSELESALDRAEASSDDECIPGPDTPNRHRTALLSLLFTAAVLLLAGVIGYTSAFVAVERAGEHTDARVAVLESDLQQRRGTAATQNANRDAQIAELRRLVCVFADHSEPRDGTVEEIRARYGCGAPSPSPSPARSGR